MINRLTYAAVALALLLATASVRAEDSKTVVSLAPEKDANAVVVELFTSQGCSSCPPAQEYLLKLSRRADVLTLEYHVDYWDQLKTWLGGSWKDPFSDPEWSQRQADYNDAITGEDRVFTPQMIVDGRLQAAGAGESAVGGLIEEARALRRRQYTLKPSVRQDGYMQVEVEGPRITDTAEVLLLRLTKEATTAIKGGENKGETMHGHNIVREMMVIGTWDGGKHDYKFSMPKFEMGQENCAVLLQDPKTRHIYAGSLCTM